MEIGSIFEINTQDLFKEGDKEFYLPFMDGKGYRYNKFFNTGRSAIEYLLKEVISLPKGTKVLLPSFICSSITGAVNRACLNVDYYSITEGFQINTESIQSKLDPTVKIIYIIQYFGSYQSQEAYDFLKDLQDQNIIIVEDISHALYTSHSEYIGFGDYVLGSLRKWLPIPDGAFLSSAKPIPHRPIEEAYNEYTFNYFVAQIMKWEYLQNKDTLDKRQFLTRNNQAMESLFSDYTIRNMTNISKNYLASYNMETLIRQRIKNYDYLYKKTKKISYFKPIFPRLEGQVPFGFIVLSEKRDKLLKYLIDKDIYCNIHWNLKDESNIDDQVAKKLSKKILTIPCDQRYGKKEMDYIIRTLESFYSQD